MLLLLLTAIVQRMMVVVVVIIGMLSIHSSSSGEVLVRFEVNQELAGDFGLFGFDDANVIGSVLLLLLLLWKIMFGCL